MVKSDVKVIYDVSNEKKPLGILRKIQMRYINGALLTLNQLASINCEELLELLGMVRKEPITLVEEDNELTAQVIDKLAKIRANADVILIVKSLGKVKEYSDKLGDHGIAIAIRVTTPLLNPGSIAKSGASYIVVPPSLVRERLIRKVLMSDVKVIVDRVNDVALYSHLQGLGIYAIITRNPTLELIYRSFLK